MYAGGLIGSFTAPILGGLLGSIPLVGGLAGSLINAYLAAWLASRTIGHADLIAAGAFGASVPGLISGVLGGAGSLFSSAGQAITSGGQTNAIPTPQQVQQPTQVPLPPASPALADLDDQSADYSYSQVS